MAKGPVTAYVEALLDRLLREHVVVVWYDRGGHFAGALDQMARPAGTRVFCFRDSFLRLWAQVEPIFSGLTRTSAATQGPILVYVPHPRPPRHLNVLLAMELAGGYYEADLPTLAREALRDRLAPDRLDELLASPGLTLAELDAIASGQGPEGLGVLSLIFGPASPVEVAARYLSEPSLEAAVAERGALPALAALCVREFGLPDAARTASQSDFKHRLARHILLGDFLASLPPGTAVPALAALSRPEGDRLVACRKVAEWMRQRVEAQPHYKEWARIVEREYQLAQAGLDPVALTAVDTFPFADDVCLAGLASAVASGGAEAALDLAVQRRGRFWAKVEENRCLRWQVAETAIRLALECRRVKSELRTTPHQPAALVQAYTRHDGGWFAVDRLHRTLEGELVDLETIDGEAPLEDLVQVARAEYREASAAMAEALWQAIARHGFHFPGVISQTDIFARFVAPHLADGPVAYLLVDALRYEMGVELARTLDQAQEVEVRPAVAVAPTITRLGMAALMPGAEKGLEVAASGQELVVRAGGQQAGDLPERLRLLDTYMGHTVLDITVGQLLSNPYRKKGKLEAELQGKRLVLVRTTEIDDHGERDAGAHTQRYMSGVLGDLKRAIRRLAEAGVRRFVVAADHGFYYGEEAAEPDKVDAPGGEQVILKARCWAGRGGATSPSFLRLRAMDLGLGGDLDFAFPVGLAVFKVPGGKYSYLHGGLSLQELVVPVITFVMAPSRTHAAGDTFRLQLRQPKVTNRLFSVRIDYQASLISPPVRRVRCEVRIGNRPAGRALAAEYGYDRQNQEIELESAKENVVTLMVETTEPTGELYVLLLDADSGAVLDKLGPVPYALSI